MEFSVQSLDSLEEHCFACLGTKELVDDITKQSGIQERVKKTFNFELEVCNGFPKFLCVTCKGKLDEAEEFLVQIQNCIRCFYQMKESQSEQLDIKQEEIVLQTVSSESEIANTANSADYTSSENEGSSESDDEPLINFIGKKKMRHKKNTFNPKLKRIPVHKVEEAIQGYREKCKENSNCVLCEFKGLNIRNLSCHMIFKHKEAKHNWCLRCNMMVENLEHHKNTHTNKVWCKFCKKNISRCHYIEHLKGHAGLDYFCTECPKKFISQKALDEHMARHKHQKPFQCRICNKAFKLFASLEDHVLTHGRYKCTVCAKNFEIPEMLASHLCMGKAESNEESLALEVHEDTPSKDDGNIENMEIFTDKVGQDSEMENVEKRKESADIKHEEDSAKMTELQVESLTCHFCQRNYKTAYKLQKHIEAHMGIFLAKCKYCDKGFSCKADMAKHERVHTKEKPFICSACGKGFVSGATLRIHMKQHTGKPEKCELCQKRFCRKSELKLHLQKHRGERPFLCTDCGKSFAQKSHLTCHLTMHSEERPYSCMVCDKAFKKKELLKHHMKLHGEKKFKCTVCLYECHKNYRLQQHMKLHEGKSEVKTNPCQLCSRSFSSLQLLNMHMSNVHSVIV